MLVVTVFSVHKYASFNYGCGILIVRVCVHKSALLITDVRNCTVCSVCICLRAVGCINLNVVTCHCFAGVHFPSITSIISKKVHDGDRALSFATSVAGSHFGWVSCIYCDIGRCFTLRVRFLSLLRHRSLVHGWVSWVCGSRPAVLCSHSVRALSDVEMVVGKNVISVR